MTNNKSSTAAPSRSRVSSNPSPGFPSNGPVSAGPYRTSFNVGVPIGSVVGAHARSGSTNTSTSSGSRGSISSITRPSFTPAPGSPYGAHARAPSLTNTDIAASPFRSSFSENVNGSNQISNGNGNGNANPSNGRKHSRIHSRNLSIFFPRPGTTAVSSIAEDGAQEIETPIDEAPVSTIPSTASSHRTTHSTTAISTPPPPPSSRSQLGGGFKFGSRPPPRGESGISEGQEGPASVPMTTNGITQNTTSSRRGHHHRHSLSHSFFSFMEPGSSPGSANNHRRQGSNITLNITNPSPTSPTHTNGSLSIAGSGPPSASGWGPISPFPHSAASAAFPPAQLLPPKRTVSFQPAALPSPSTQRSSSIFHKLLALPREMRNALIFGFVEGALGCALWVLAQHYESLACTGMAYWIAFDAFGVGIGVYGKMIEAGAGQGSLRLPYGCVFRELFGFLLIILAVPSERKRLRYLHKLSICSFLQCTSAKRLWSTLFYQQGMLDITTTILQGKTFSLPRMSTLPICQIFPDNSPRLNYPSTFLWLSFITLSLSSTLHKTNHAILSASRISLPSPRAIYRLFTSPSPSPNTPLRTSSSLLLSNPYTLFPLACTLFLLLLSTLPLRPEALRKADMLLAGIEALGTAYLAWPACHTLGAVLLQTAPSRASPPDSSPKETLTVAKGTMEAFLRTMKEIERHPLVLHLPAPHVWQLSPAISVHPNSESKQEEDFRPRLAGAGNGHARMLSHSPSFARLRGGGGGSGSGVKMGSGKVIVALELHVSKELEDVECLELTRWAWQRCVAALGQGEEGVTVGIVRG